MRIICILGKSGSGKSTIESKLESLGYNRIVSYTTRKPRGNEVNGREYHFITDKQFSRLIEKNILMEHATYNGNMYGAPRPVGAVNYVIVVEADGYRKIKQMYGSQAIGVYVSVPDDIIEERINNRGDTTDKDFQNRREQDKKKFYNIANEVDLVVDGRESVDVSVLKILEYIRSRDNA